MSRSFSLSLSLLSWSFSLSSRSFSLSFSCSSLSLTWYFSLSSTYCSNNFHVLCILIVICIIYIKQLCNSWVICLKNRCLFNSSCCCSFCLELQFILVLFVLMLPVGGGLGGIVNQYASMVEVFLLFA